MKVTNREAILLCVLGVLIILFSFHKFIYTPQMVKVTELKETLSQLTMQKKAIDGNIKKDSSIDDEYNSINKELSTTTGKFFNSIIQEELIIIIDKLIKESKVLMNSIEFTEIELKDIKLIGVEDNGTTHLEDLGESILILNKLVKGKEEEQNDVETKENDEEDPSDQLSKKLLRSITAIIDVEGSYEDIMKFMGQIESYKKKIYIEDMAVEAQEDGRLSAKFTLLFYSVPSLSTTESSLIKWEHVKTTGVLFKQKNNQGVSKELYDLVMMLKSYTSDMPTVVLGRANDSQRQSYVYADSEGFANAFIQVKKVDDKYMVNYRAGEHVYPLGGKDIEIVPVANELNLLVNADKRLSSKDRSGVKLTIDNNTELPFRITVKKDDKDSTRIKVIDKKDNVIIKRGVSD